ncbi:TonB-dependent receptor [Sphingomonas sp. CFBP 13720]|uniref:TonB-dependent receptor n=1 Tax=Sphingomonas sp. CFBP 13720 TaxID=2775302 RepID=UPI00177D6F87|nr:TonB-dependent receptor [Sphingomonas sp. CFBP 13720]MBD8679876.1 TonB-dependent receptor [Sphingomonas sp. CFBP 13720]
MSTIVSGRGFVPTRRTLPFILLALLAGTSLPALAQTTPAGDSTGSAALGNSAASSQEDAQAGDDIIVTATRRNTTIQQTPLAITALTGDTLTDAGVTNIADYAKFVPSLRIQDNGPGSRRVSLRGVQAPGEPTVGTYYDDVPVTGSVGVSSDAAGRTADFSLFDIERIEVLRGPQGTLYGSSSMGGAIRVIFNKPSDEFEGNVEATASDVAGGGLGYFVNGMVNVPVVSDKLAARLVLYQRESDGWIDNRFLGRDDVNDYNATGGRLSLRWSLADSSTIDAVAMYEETDANSYSFNPQLGQYVSAAQVLLPYKDTSQLYSLTGTTDLGGATLTSILAYQQRTSAYAADDSYYIGTFRTPGRCASAVNGSANAACSPTQLNDFYAYLDGLSPAAIYYPGTTKDLTSEVRLSSSGTNVIDWTVGGFFQDRDNRVTSSDARADRATGEIIFPVQLFYRREIVDRLKQFAGFGEATYHPTPTIGLTAGIRYFDYKKSVTGFTDIGWTLIGAPVRSPSTVDTSENGTLLKFNASWEPTSNILLYGSASQGFRPGGANQVIGLPAELTPYQSDKLWNYEIGSKLDLFGRLLTLNLAAYQIDWDNIQVRGRTTNGAFSFLANAGAARVRGAEIEAFIRPARGLLVTVSANHVSAKLTENQVSDVVNGAGRIGDRIPDIPDWSGAISAEYTRPVAQGIDLFARGDVNYVGSFYSEFRPDNIYRVKVDEYALANLRIGAELTDSDTGVYLFVNNLFNAYAINRASNGSTPNSFSATAAAPRTIGINIRRRF